jgi:hypothetical protein
MASPLSDKEKKRKEHEKRYHNFFNNMAADNTVEAVVSPTEDLVKILACEYGEIDSNSVLKCILDGADVNYRRRYARYSLFQTAAKKHETCIIQAMLTAPALRVEIRPGHIMSSPAALMMRRVVSDDAIISTLERMAVVCEPAWSPAINASTVRPPTLMHSAIMNRRPRIVAYLINRTTPNLQQWGPGLFHMFIAAGGASIHNYALMTLVKHGYRDTSRFSSHGNPCTAFELAASLRKWHFVDVIHPFAIITLEAILAMRTTFWDDLLIKILDRVDLRQLSLDEKWSSLDLKRLHSSSNDAMSTVSAYIEGMPSEVIMQRASQIKSPRDRVCIIKVLLRKGVTPAEIIRVHVPEALMPWNTSRHRVLFSAEFDKTVTHLLLAANFTPTIPRELILVIVNLIPR